MGSTAGHRPPWHSRIMDLPAFLVSVFIMYWSLPLGAVTGHVKFARMKGPRDDMFGWSRFMKEVFAVRALKLGTVQLYRGGPCMYLCNHRSWADFFLDCYFTEGRAALMSRWLVFWVFPVFLSVCHIIGGVVLFKRGTQVNIENFNQWLDSRLASNPGSSLLVFPEGHRSTKASSLMLKRGMLRYAYGRKMPVQAVIAAGKEHVLSEKMGRAHFGRRVVVSYAEVLHSTKFATFEEFLEAVQGSWDALWLSVYSASAQGLPELRPQGCSYDYPPAMRYAHFAVTFASFPLLIAAMYLTVRLAATVSRLFGPLEMVVAAVCVIWFTVSLVRAWLPDSSRAAQGATPRGGGGGEAVGNQDKPPTTSAS